MLSELRIENFAIIDILNLEFKPGLITFTGETGAGKSIIIDAVEVLIGGRAEATMLRTGTSRATLEATFRIDAKVRPEVHAVLKREELMDDPDFVVLGREIRAEGPNVARINGRTVNVSLLRELGEYLIDVHGQSEHLSLLRVPEHINLLDRYALVDGSKAAYTETYRQLHAVDREINELRKMENEAARRADLLEYQINEIKASRLNPAEEEELREERNRLANAEALASLAQQALIALDDGTPESPAATDLFGEVVDALEDLARIDPTQSERSEQAQTFFTGLSELARELRAYLEEVEFNPKRLNFVEDRLNLIHTLKRKYGDSIPAILAYQENAEAELDSITHAEERLESLQTQREALLVELGNRGQALSEKRRAAAQRLTSEMERELADLRMPEAQFQIDFQQQEDANGAPVEGDRRVAYDVTGLERVEFLIAPNPGEGLKPLVKIASGGETSRLMLALKNVLARADHVPALIFDEIDQGIGGRVGAIVGQKLWRLARLHQVMCITHLPQLAAFAEQHYQVRKQIQEGRTITLVEELNGDARLREIATMMGELSEGTLHSAEEMLDTVAQLTTREHA